MNLYFWQNKVSLHLFPFQRELSSFGHIVTIIVEKKITQDRINQGWFIPEDPDRVTIVQSPSDEQADAFLRNTNSIHFLEGIKGFSYGYYVLKRGAKLGVNFFIVSEVPYLRGFKGFLRRFAGFFIERRHRDKVLAVLCIGQDALSWYQYWGYENEKIFPFIYVTEENYYAESTTNINSKDVFRIGFVGQFIRRKGVDVLLSSLQLFNKRTKSNWQLSLVGDGPLKSKLVSLADQQGISDKVVFQGVVSNDNVGDYMRSIDLLVLPSRFDGWGAVVNESLMVGTPVVVSDKCGSRELVRSCYGQVFESENSDSLCAAIVKIQEDIKNGRLERENIVKFARNSLKGKIIAEYLHQVLIKISSNDTKSIVPPWYEV